jgi:hypothetical protein
MCDWKISQHLFDFETLLKSYDPVGNFCLIDLLSAICI